MRNVIVVIGDINRKMRRVIRTDRAIYEGMRIKTIKIKTDDLTPFLDQLRNEGDTSRNPYLTAIERFCKQNKFQPAEVIDVVVREGWGDDDDSEWFSKYAFKYGQGQYWPHMDHVTICHDNGLIEKV